MRYLSVCSGIEAASVAFQPLGWTAVGFSEIEPFPCAVLRHHYPETINFGDLTAFRSWPDATVDVLIGGTPCQSFSVAGLRKGLADPRGNLALTYLAVAERYRPRWVVWENVPGVLSSVSHDAPDAVPPPYDLDGDDGPPDGTEIVVEDEYDADESHAFGCFLAGLSDLGYGLAYRVLDAQYFGLAQRRKRVFVVGHLGDWRRAAAVLLEPSGLSWHPAPRRETRQGIADGAAQSLTASGRGVERTGESRGQDPVVIAPPMAGTLLGGSASAASHNKPSHYTRDKDGAPSEVAPPLSADADKGDQDTLLFAFDDQRGRAAGGVSVDQARTLHSAKGQSEVQLVAFTSKDYGGDAELDLSPTLRAGTHDGSHANGGVMPAVAYGISADALDRSGEGAAGDAASRSGLGVVAECSPTVKARHVNAVAIQTGVNEHAVAFQTRGSNVDVGDVSGTFGSNADRASGSGPMVAFQEAAAFNHQSGGDMRGIDLRETAQLQRDQTTAAMIGMQVRRLTPTECARLQGFPDDYLDIIYNGKPAADGQKYKALGNSFAVPVVRWIGQRIQAVEDIPNEE